MRTKFYLFLFLAAFTPLFYACSDDDNDDDTNVNNPEEQSDNAYVNNWTYEEMDEWYLWRDLMPKKTALNFESDPETFFKSLLYSKEWPNRPEYSFSRIESSHDDLLKSASLSSSTSSASLGFEYMTVPIEGSSTDVVFVVSYVYSKTNAETNGLKRGDIIFKVDNKTVTYSNYSTILNTGDKFDFFIYNAASDKYFNLLVSKTQGFEENPILFDSIYTDSTFVNKIGYLVYNSFTPKDLVDREYDVLLLKKLAEFKSKGVTDVILDLRYNGGGYLSSAQALASALVPDLSTSAVMDIMEYNPIKQKELINNPAMKDYLSDNFIDKIYNSSNKQVASVPTLGKQLQNLYVIVTENTASASELIINALQPYYSEASKTLKVVGETTVGKNVGSFAIYEDDDDRNSYVLWPISFRIYNKENKSDYSEGIKPDIEVLEFSDLTSVGIGWRNLGDRNEVLLKTAINHIIGVYNQSAVFRSSSAARFTLTKTIGSSNDKKVLNNTIIKTKKKDSL